MFGELGASNIYRGNEHSKNMLGGTAYFLTALQNVVIGP